MSGSVRLCYDSTDPNAIPADAELVLQYIDGANRAVVDAWSAAAVGRFAAARKVRVACLASTNDGHMLDVEQGNATPEQAPGWVRMRRAAGTAPTVYVNLSNWGAVRQAFASQGIAEPHYLLADYDNDPTIPAGAIGKQYANAPLTGGNYDLSSIAPVWPGVDEGEDMDPTTQARLAALLAGLAGDDANAQGGGADYRSIRAVLYGAAGPVHDLLAAVKAELDQLSTHSDPSVAQAAARIESALSQAGAALGKA